MRGKILGANVLKSRVLFECACNGEGRQTLLLCVCDSLEARPNKKDKDEDD